MAVGYVDCRSQFWYGDVVSCNIHSEQGVQHVIAKLYMVWAQVCVGQMRCPQFTGFRASYSCRGTTSQILSAFLFLPVKDDQIKQPMPLEKCMSFKRILIVFARPSKSFQASCDKFILMCPGMHVKISNLSGGEKARLAIVVPPAVGPVLLSGKHRRWNFPRPQMNFPCKHLFID